MLLIQHKIILYEQPNKDSFISKGDGFMPQKKKKDPVQSAKNQSIEDKSFNSLNSETGYQETGNDAQVQAKARALRNKDNGSHM